MESFYLGLVFGVVISSVLAVIIYFYLLRRIASKLFEAWKEKEMRKELDEALQKQRYVVKGKITEQLFPIIYEKINDISDARFIGSPVDYIVFDGLSKSISEGRDDVKIRFIEVKTGDAKLNSSERLVKDAVENRRVEWEEVKLP
ncbi:MAG: hypothetical protein OH316_01615 [Candidatus Parvarchaeota archaeon]|nr:hypothetical protein [Candidatus Parvarchaeota archaeon]